MIAFTPHLPCTFLEERDIYIGNLKNMCKGVGMGMGSGRLGAASKAVSSGPDFRKLKYAGLPATERSKTLHNVQSHFVHHCRENTVQRLRIPRRTG